MSVKNLFADEEFEFPEVSDREMACERLLFNTTEDIILAMQDSGINQSELASKLGKSKPYISQLLDGTRNMTLKTLSDISFALGAEARVKIIRNGVDVSHPLVPEKKAYSSSLSNISSDNARIIRITIKPSNLDFVAHVTK